MKAMRTIYILILAFFATATAMSAENMLDTVVRFRDAIYADSAANVSGTLRAANGILYGLEVRNASGQQNAATFGEPGLGRVFIYVQQVGSEYFSTIKSSTNVPLVIDGAGRAVNIYSGLNVASGTTAFGATTEVLHSPMRIVGATDSRSGLHLARSATDTTGLKIHVDAESKNIVLTNDQPGASHFVFDPPLTNLTYPGDATSMIVYADRIQASATDPTILTTYIVNTMYDMAWDQLLDSASAYTIIEYVSNVSNWITTHAELIFDSTGTSIPNYIEDRITSRLVSLASLMISGTGTFENIVANNSISAASITSTTYTYLGGTVIFASAATIIGYPTYDMDVSDLDTRIITNYGMILSLMDDVDGLESTSSVNVLTVSDVLTIGASHWEYELPEWDSVGASYYDRRFRVVKFIKINLGGELVPYAVLLPGATMGSHRGVRVNFDDPISEALRIDLLAFLEAAAGDDYRDLRDATEAFGIASRTISPLSRLGKITGRM